VSEPEIPALPQTAREAAALLAEIGTLLELRGGDAFRARAFTNAARTLEGSGADLGALAREDRLTTLRGVGSGIASVLAEYLLTGRSRLRDELRAATPLGMYDLLRVPGLGPKRIHTLFATLGVDSLDALEEAAGSGRVAELPGFGARTQDRILAGIGFARSSRERRRYPDALELAVRLLEWLRARTDVREAEIAGELRRRLEVVDRIDLVAASPAPDEVLDAFRSAHGTLHEPASSGGEATIRLTDGMTVRLRCVSPGTFVAAMVWETGAVPHVEALAARARKLGGSLDAGGLTLGGRRLRPRRESRVYEQLGLQYVPPELREGLGEVELAAAGELPRLVEVGDLRGTFHCHTTASDGKATLREMADAARERGWSYLGIADHSRTAAYAGGLTIEEVREQHAEIDRLNVELSTTGATLRIFKGIESDILRDGGLDYPDDVLRDFDYVVGSVHSSFRVGRDEMTRRVIRAVEHPSLTIIGHPTGRLLLSREGYDIDVDAVLRAAAANGVAVEINADPRRLDLDWRNVRTAAELGIMIAINPDAHSVRALDNLAFGVNMARKAGLEPGQVLNTWPVTEVAEYLAERKRKSQA
jgi:DNA polymerase (family X)